MTKKSLYFLLLAAAAAHAEPVTYRIDPTHTFVTFEVRHFGTSTIRGRFEKKEGSIVFDRAAKTGRVEMHFDTASVSTGVGSLNGAIRGANLLNSTEFPNASFAANRFVFEGEQLKSVEGLLTIVGKTHPVTLTATNFNCYEQPMTKREVCGGDFETTIQRTRWGLPYAVSMVSDDVRLLVQVEATRE